ncbi:MAG: hypothetical protein IPK88_18300 [Saprospiraceae bacterium]|nr:hypothetical protein [Candidatus Defluviibacterium haderslevense]
MINLFNDSKDLFLYLIPTCPIVDGPVRSCIYDLNRCDYYFIPRSLSDFLKKNNRVNLKDVKDLILKNEQFLNLIGDMYEREYLDFIDFDTMSLFSDLQFTKNQLNLLEIVECLIEENKWSIIYEFIVESLENGARHIILFYKGDDVRFIEKFLSIICDFNVESIILFLNSNYSIEWIMDLENKYLKLCKIYCSSNANNCIIKSAFRGSNFAFITNNSFESLLPLNIDVNYFSVNIVSFTQAFNFNLYYKGRVYFDGEFIKNSIQSQNIGIRFKKDDLQNLINSELFNLLPNSKKNEIDPCKNCEHKYMCYDPRIPIKLNNILTYESDCKYNYYTNLWFEQEGFEPLSFHLLGNKFKS